MRTISLFFFISLVFSPLAAAMAFIITYEEYKKQMKKPQALKHAGEVAFFTFLVFMGIGVAVGYIVSKGILN